MSNAAKNIATVEHAAPPALQSEAGAIIAMIERAATNPAVDIDKMERLFRMHGDVVARNAKTAYAAALSSMQPDLPVIVERGKIDIGRGKPQSYARWEDINDAIKPVLAKHGFALSFRCGQSDTKISVTGVLSHREGHSEETTMHLPIDNSGSKNAVQAVGSSTSYGKRYTAAALLNLSSRGEDDDGKAAGLGPLITQDDTDTLRDLLESTGCPLPKFLSHMGIKTITDLPAAKFNEAKTALSNYANNKASR